MMDTIDLLEAIGSDASLRHLPGDELATKLEQAEASDALKTAAANGDRAPLTIELGREVEPPPQSTQFPAEEEPEEEDSPKIPEDKVL
jgi:hypothetical protein